MSYFPEYYEYNNRARVFAGHRALEKIPEILEASGSKKPLIITDKGVAAAGLLDILTDSLDRFRTAGTEDDVPPDSDSVTVERIAGRFRDLEADSIIALGGGSVIDTAKGVNILVSGSEGRLSAYAGAGKIKFPLKPLIAVPTTSGTGSEATLVAVISDHESGRKMLFTSPSIIPHAAVLDSRMTASLPPALTAATGMDALTHAVEAYTCLGKNPLSDAQALKAVRLISGNLLTSAERPDDLEARLQLAIGANLAGSAFSNSMVGMVHTIGHALGAVCHVPHGTCMSILLPFGLEYNTAKIKHLLPDIYDSLDADMDKNPDHPDKASGVISEIRKINDRLSEITGGRHTTRLRDIRNREGSPSVKKEDFPLIAETALGDGSIFYNPEELEYGDITGVLKKAW